MGKIFVDFTGKETEKEFLEKCVKQWGLTMESGNSLMAKLVEIAIIFDQMRHRINNLK